MKPRMTQVDAFGFFLNFNKSTYDYSEFTNMLVKKGFVRRFPRIGYLVAKGESFVTNKELLEHQTRLIESDPEKISVMNKHSVVSCISINSGKEIVICNHQETPKFQFNSSEILKEVVSVVDVLKDVVGYENLTPGRLLIASSVKAEKRPHLVLANFDIDKLSYFKKIMPDLEIARWENEIYLYSANIERTGGPGPIIEDMKLKVLPKQTIGSKKVWDHIVFTPRPGGYDIIMQYMSDDLDDLINTFKENEILASTMVNELETLDS